MSLSLDLLEKFERSSGLKINHTKTDAFWLGEWKNREDTPFKFNWPKDSVYALGIHFSNSKKVSDKPNFYEKLDVLEKKQFKELEEKKTNSIRQDQHR